MLTMITMTLFTDDEADLFGSVATFAFLMIFARNMWATLLIAFKLVRDVLVLLFGKNPSRRRRVEYSRSRSPDAKPKLSVSLLASVVVSSVEEITSPDRETMRRQRISFENDTPNPRSGTVIVDDDGQVTREDKQTSTVRIQYHIIFLPNNIHEPQILTFDCCFFSCFQSLLSEMQRKARFRKHMNALFRKPKVSFQYCVAFLACDFSEPLAKKTKTSHV